MSSITVRFGSVGLAIWLALGVLYHLITSDIPFSWGDPWLYVTMALWPFMFLGWVILFFVVCFVLWVGIQYYDEQTKKRQNAKRVANFRKERKVRSKGAPTKPTTPPDQS